MFKKQCYINLLKKTYNIKNNTKLLIKKQYNNTTYPVDNYIKQFFYSFLKIKRIVMLASKQKNSLNTSMKLFKFFKSYINYSMKINSYIFINHIKMFSFIKKVLRIDI